MAPDAGVFTTRTSWQPGLMSPVAGAATKSPVPIDYLERLNGLLLDENGGALLQRGPLHSAGLLCDRRAGEAERAGWQGSRSC